MNSLQQMAATQCHAVLFPISYVFEHLFEKAVQKLFDACYQAVLSGAKGMVSNVITRTFLTNSGAAAAMISKFEIANGFASMPIVNSRSTNTRSAIQGTQELSGTN
jgi:hypothetical protein